MHANTHQSHLHDLKEGIYGVDTNDLMVFHHAPGAAPNCEGRVIQKLHQAGETCVLCRFDKLRILAEIALVELCWRGEFLVQDTQILAADVQLLSDKRDPQPTLLEQRKTCT